MDQDSVTYGGLHQNVPMLKTRRDGLEVADGKLTIRARRFLRTLEDSYTVTGDYDLWSMRIEQYLTHTDYALWEVIVNGNAPAVASASAEGPIPPKTTEQKLARKNELKAKSTMLLAILDEHLLKIHGIKNQRKCRRPFRHSNMRILLHQDLKDWIKPMIDCQGAIGGIKVMGCVTKVERKGNSVYEAEIKGQSSSSSNSQNVAFVSSENTSSTNEEVNVPHEVSTASSQGQASSLTYADDIMFSFFANQSNSPQLDNEDLE
ncbi:hypothetical protein Tco_1032393 [Tanacetum coccineum]|uniref:Uncharacterized protein n=1 Tax=Tanacetum coccineum TaxID=301880 RepID=A0ABQ5GDU3_9ASTR